MKVGHQLEVQVRASASAGGALSCWLRPAGNRWKHDQRRQRCQRRLLTPQPPAGSDRLRAIVAVCGRVFRRSAASRSQPVVAAASPRSASSSSAPLSTPPSSAPHTPCSTAAPLPSRLPPSPYNPSDDPSSPPPANRSANGHRPTNQPPQPASQPTRQPTSSPTS